MENDRGCCAIARASRHRFLYGGFGPPGASASAIHRGVTIV